MKTKILGVILLLLIIAGGIAYQQFFSSPKTTILKGYVGGEKMAFLDNPEVKKILQKQYGLELNATKAGSIEMVKDLPARDVDFLWPSSQVALELFKMNNYPLVKSEIIFNSPIVLYSWDLITQALTASKIVTQEGGIYYVTQFKQLIQHISDGRKWSDIGLNELFGKIAITTTDPTKSNSGNMFAAC